MSHKLRITSIAVGTCLHFVMCLAGVVIVAVSKTRSEVALPIIGFCLPFAISGGLLGITQGIKQPAATGVLSAALASTLVMALIQCMNRTMMCAEFVLIPSVLLSASAATSIRLIKKKANTHLTSAS